MKKIKYHLIIMNISNFFKSLNNYSSLISAAASCVMVIIAIIMLSTLRQNSEALKIASNSLKLQEREFNLRNRPIIDVKKAQFGGAIKLLEGKEYPQTVEFAIENVSDIPATQFKAFCDVLINDKSVSKNNIEIGVITKGTPLAGHAGLNEKTYKNILNNHNKLSINVIATYSGMLKEKPNEYGISFSIHYFPHQNEFKISNKKYK